MLNSDEAVGKFLIELMSQTIKKCHKMKGYKVPSVALTKVFKYCDILPPPTFNTNIDIDIDIDYKYST